MDIQEEHIESDNLIYIATVNGGVIVSPKLLREFRVKYNNDLNRLIRDATKL